MPTFVQDSIDRISPTLRPRGRAAGYHAWLDLFFLHWRVPVSLLRPLVPPQLTIDTFDGDAWLGVVPFHLRGVRPWWFPAVPGSGSFNEVNVRTYAHLERERPGVWFFSLDADSWPVVRVARWKWGLNYQFAKMSFARRAARMEYASQRRSGAAFDFAATVHAGEGTAAQPGTLEHFLVERYILYSRDSAGELWTGRVHHAPYPLQSMQIERLSESLTAASAISISGPPDHAVYSPGAQVEVFGLHRAK